jgi:AhpD family alkylhydroperoxidase
VAAKLVERGVRIKRQSDRKKYESVLSGRCPAESGREQAAAPWDLRPAGRTDGMATDLNAKRTSPEETVMSTVKLVSDEEATGLVAEVFADIRETRKTDFINNFWRAIAVDGPLLKATWEEVKGVMAVPGELDPMTREMIYVAVSIANACSYCVHSHTASARAKGMTDAQYAELLKIVSLAAKTNHLVTAMQVPVDPEFDLAASKD